MYNDYVSNPLFVIDYDDDPENVSTARDSDQSNFSDCYTNAMANASCEIPRNVFQASLVQHIRV